MTEADVADAHILSTVGTATSAVAKELGADKLPPLSDQPQAGDFVDVAAPVDRFELEQLFQLASEKDGGASGPQSSHAQSNTSVRPRSSTTSMSSTR